MRTIGWAPTPMTATGNPVGRLGDAVSPYLQSHADQPVDWYPWGVEAFSVAAKRNVPVLVSIGYHTCHWCHVMSRESFSDPETAQVINDNLVAIKVDREEHPEVDSVYMAQAAAFTENLGWPLNVFVTPDGAAFYAATYLPPTATGGLASLREVVTAVARAWAEKRDDVEDSARALTGALGEASQASLQVGGVEQPTSDHLGAVVEVLRSQEDTEWGGFGGAPKFPVAPVLNFLLGRGRAGNVTANELAHRALEAYRASPLLDPVEGGFFRYATQRNFSEPHYERMLYDNAGLLSGYAHAGLLDTAAGIVGFFREQLSVLGALGSATDSESVIDGQRVEGGYFQLSVKQRVHHTPPALDEKVVTGWNGMALEALAVAHRAGVSGDSGRLGTEIAEWLWEHHVKPDGTLVRVSRAGVLSAAPATLEDYGGFALGLLEMGLATGDAEFVSRAKTLADAVLLDPQVLAGDPVLEAHALSGVGDINEGASPSGPSLMARAALKLAALTGEHHYREWAWSLVQPFVTHALAAPLAFGGVLRVLSELAEPSRELVVVADAASDLSATALAWQAEGAITVVVSSEQAEAFVAAGFGLFDGRTDGVVPTAYLCEGGVCKLPVTTAEELRAKLAQ
jgi:uncharacterized protein